MLYMKVNASRRKTEEMTSEPPLPPKSAAELTFLNHSRPAY